MKIINQLFKVGVFAGQLKTSKVLSLFKKGNASNISNYRLISLLPTISKPFEKAMLEQFTIHVDINNLIQNCQYGFTHIQHYLLIQLLIFLEVVVSSRFISIPYLYKIA